MQQTENTATVWAASLLLALGKAQASVGLLPRHYEFCVHRPSMPCGSDGVCLQKNDTMDNEIGNGAEKSETNEQLSCPWTTRFVFYALQWMKCVDHTPKKVSAVSMYTQPWFRTLCRQKNNMRSRNGAKRLIALTLLLRRCEPESSLFVGVAWKTRFQFICLPCSLSCVSCEDNTTVDSQAVANYYFPSIHFMDPIVVKGFQPRLSLSC